MDLTLKRDEDICRHDNSKSLNW